LDGIPSSPTFGAVLIALKAGLLFLEWFSASTVSAGAGDGTNSPKANFGIKNWKERKMSLLRTDYRGRIRDKPTSAN
jgi:hypothetical protein